MVNTEEKIQGKWFRVGNIGEFEITEFVLAGPNCSGYQKEAAPDYCHPPNIRT